MTHDEIDRLFESHFGYEAVETVEVGADPAPPNLLGNVSSGPAPTAAATGSGQSATTSHAAPMPQSVVPPTSTASAPLPSPASPVRPSGPALVTPTPTAPPTAAELATSNPATRGSYLKNHHWWIEAIIASLIGIVTFKVVHHPKIGVFKQR